MTRRPGIVHTILRTDFRTRSRNRTCTESCNSVGYLQVSRKVGARFVWLARTGELVHPGGTNTDLQVLPRLTGSQLAAERAATHGQRAPGAQSDYPALFGCLGSYLKCGGNGRGWQSMNRCSFTPKTPWTLHEVIPAQIITSRRLTGERLIGLSAVGPWEQKQIGRRKYYVDMLSTTFGLRFGHIRVVLQQLKRVRTVVSGMRAHSLPGEAKQSEVKPDLHNLRVS